MRRLASGEQSGQMLSSRTLVHRAAHAHTQMIEPVAPPIVNSIKFRCNMDLKSTILLMHKLMFRACVKA